MTGSSIYLPTEDDLSKMQKKSGKKQEFWEEDKIQSLREKPYSATNVENLRFNTEFAFVSGSKINLSKHQLADLATMTEEDLKILNRDLSLKTRSQMREPIGFVTRGAFSQNIGTGLAICALKKTSV